MEKIIYYRNKTMSFLYQNVIKRVAFQFPPEKAHNFFVFMGKVLGSNTFTKAINRMLFYYEHPMLNQRILGINFVNPVGLSAGFDKNAELISTMEDVGFGFVEVGSITKLEGFGNEGMRLRRLPKKKALWVYLGLNNKGADETVNKLQGRKYKIPFGVSIAKTNCPETVDDGVGKKDYLYSLKKFNDSNVGAFYDINISCPNAYGGQPFSRAKAYESLLKENDKLGIKKPVFVKLSPDLSKKELDDILRISGKHKIAGFIISNLTKKHSFGNGGLSGKAVQSLADKMLKYVYSKTKGKYVLIGVGGIFNAEDAYKKVKLGASLVELITGMIYQGPNIIGEINYGLVRLLKKDGYKNISEAVGKDVKLVS